MNEVILKPDRRFKPGNIKRTGMELRGHPDTISISRTKKPELSRAVKRLVDTEQAYVDSLKLQLMPPIVVSRELGDELEKRL